jgi:hypothetical protein
MSFPHYFKSKLARFATYHKKWSSAIQPPSSVEKLGRGSSPVSSNLPGKLVKDLDCVTLPTEYSNKYFLLPAWCYKLGIPVYYAQLTV